MAKHYDFDDYLHPENDKVLINLPGFSDPDELSRFEYLSTIAREYQLRAGEVAVPTTFGSDHIQAIHRHLFSAVYEWAGEYRTVNMSKALPDSMQVAGEPKKYSNFMDRAHIDRGLAFIRETVQTTYWQGLSHDAAAYELAAIHSQLNYVHPFREGNGRSTRVFMDQLIKHAGYEPAKEYGSQASFVEAVVESHFHNLEPLAKLTRDMIVPIGTTRPTPGLADTGIQATPTLSPQPKPTKRVDYGPRLG